jgi:hypothetical protein
MSAKRVAGRMSFCEGVARQYKVPSNFRDGTPANGGVVTSNATSANGGVVNSNGTPAEGARGVVDSEWHTSTEKTFRVRTNASQSKPTLFSHKRDCCDPRVLSRRCR